MINETWYKKSSTIKFSLATADLEEAKSRRDEVHPRIEMLIKRAKEIGRAHV